MRRVEITEKVLKVGRMEFHEGDTYSFDDEVAQQFIDLGWVKCCETGEQGERKPGSHKLEVGSIRQKISQL